MKRNEKIIYLITEIFRLEREMWEVSGFECRGFFCYHYKNYDNHYFVKLYHKEIELKKELRKEIGFINYYFKNWHKLRQKLYEMSKM